MTKQDILKLKTRLEIGHALASNKDLWDSETSAHLAAVSRKETIIRFGSPDVLWTPLRRKEGPPMNHTGKLRCMTALYLTRGGYILCLRRNGGRVAGGKWVGAAGGHFESGELNDARACVLRELWEELGLTEDDLIGLSLRYITLRLKDGEVRQNYYFFAELKKMNLSLTSTEGELQWFLPEQLKDLPMPGSAKHMLAHWVEIGRDGAGLYGGVSTAAGAEFIRLEEYDD